MHALAILVHVLAAPKCTSTLRWSASTLHSYASSHPKKYSSSTFKASANSLPRSHSVMSLGWSTLPWHTSSLHSHASTLPWHTSSPPKEYPSSIFDRFVAVCFSKLQTALSTRVGATNHLPVFSYQRPLSLPRSFSAPLSSCARGRSRIARPSTSHEPASRP